MGGRTREQSCTSHSPAVPWGRQAVGLWVVRSGLALRRRQRPGLKQKKCSGCTRLDRFVAQALGLPRRDLSRRLRFRNIRETTQAADQDPAAPATRTLERKSGSWTAAWGRQVVDTGVDGGEKASSAASPTRTGPGETVAGQRAVRTVETYGGPSAAPPGSPTRSSNCRF